MKEDKERKEDVRRKKEWERGMREDKERKEDMRRKKE